MKRIIAWVILIALLLFSSPYAQDDIDTTVWSQPLLWSPIDTFRTPQRDTTRVYIKEIKQKCDTTWVPFSEPCEGVFYGFRKIKCVNDTIWADKVPVWLTPTELEQLMGLFGNSADSFLVLPQVMSKEEYDEWIKSSELKE